MANTAQIFSREWFIHDLDEGSSPKYYGFQDNEGNYYIMRATDTDTVYRYASLKNNPSYELYSSAWTDRATLIYGEIQEAY